MALPHRFSHEISGDPLYRYRCTDEEFEHIREALHEVLSKRCLKDLHQSEQAAFCLFAAEWWRRYHTAGPWRYQGVFNDLVTDMPPQSEIRYAIERGMKFWKRRILIMNGKSYYLMTLACEGGLPLQLIQKQGTALRHFFKSILEYLRDFSWTGREHVSMLSEIAKKQKFSLPLTLRQEVVYTLAGELVGRIWELRRECREFDSKDPLGALDRQQPGWRETLPLNITEQTAEALIRGLLLDANEVVKQQQSARIRLNTVLERHHSGSWRLYKQLQLPRRIDHLQLQELFATKRTIEEFPRRLSIFLRNLESEDAHYIGMLVRHQGKNGLEWKLDVMQTDEVAKDPEATFELRIQARGFNSLSCEKLEGGLMLPSLPWIFAPINESLGVEWKLVATGSHRHASTSLLLALPNYYQRPSSENANIKECGELQQGKTARKLFRIEGVCEIQIPEADGGGVIRVRTGQGEECSSLYEFSGSTIPMASDPLPTWRGVPWLDVCSENGSRQKISWKDLQAKGSQSKTWRTLTPDMVGCLTIRHVVDGEIHTQQECRIAPGDLKCDISIGDTKRPGRVELYSHQLSDAGVAHQADFTLEKETLKSGKFRFSLQSETDPPTRFLMNLAFHNGETLSLTLPFPQTTAHFEGRDGQRLPNNHSIHISHLGGVRAVICTHEEKPGLYVEAKLLGQDSPPLRFRIPSMEQGIFSLDLRDLESAVMLLMSTSSDLDAKVRLEIFQLGVTRLKNRLVVSRYDWCLDKDGARGEVSLPDVKPELRDEIIIEARPLASPDQVEELQIAEGEEGLKWLFYHDKRTPGAWLITARQNEWYRGRPLLWSVPLKNEGLSALVTAIETPPKDRGHRMQEALQELFDCPGHDDWRLVEKYMALLGDLPPSTFDLIQNIAGHPGLVALCALRTQHLDDFWAALEELPFMWELIPRSSWLEALGAFWQTLKPLQEINLDLSQQALQSAVDRIVAKFDVFGFSVLQWSTEKDIELNIASSEVGILKDPAQIKAFKEIDLLAKLQEDEIRQIRQRVGDDWWPTFELRTELESLSRSLHRQCKQILSQRWQEQPSGTRYTTAIINAPLAATICAYLGIKASRPLTLFLREAKAFDEPYFEQSYRIQMMQLYLSHTY